MVDALQIKSVKGVCQNESLRLDIKVTAFILPLCIPLIVLYSLPNNSLDGPFVNNDVDV